MTLIQTDWRGSMNQLPLSTRGLFFLSLRNENNKNKPLEPGY
jgi:hypothetical protein